MTEVTDFTKLNLPKQLVQALEKMNFTNPTPIQAASIPLALKGKDILGSAQTGTGKTAAFGIPLVSHLLSSRGTAIVMTPTRELAVQVMATMKQLIAFAPQIKTAVLIGGEPMPKQYNQLKQRPRLIVGTPGRINDHLERGTLMLNEANFLVLDETDRMLDMGFGVQIDRVLHFMPKKRQTLLFSATLPANIVRLSKQYLNEPERVTAGEVSQPITRIEQETIQINHSEKYAKLTEELANRSGSVIVFVKSKHGADKLAYRLSKDEHESEAIHGDLRQNKRDKVIRQFREGKYRVLVATDIAARGLDIPHIEHVINFDLPQVAEDYVHRIGRTGRNGAEGKALNFVSSEDNAKWKAIQRLLNPNQKQESEGSSSENSAPKTGKRKPAGGYAKKRPFGSRNKFRDGDSRPARDDNRSFGGRDGNREGGNRSARDDNRSFGDRDGNRNFGERGDRNGNRQVRDDNRGFGGRDGNRNEGRDRNRDGNSSGGRSDRDFRAGDFRDNNGADNGYRGANPENRGSRGRNGGGNGGGGFRGRSSEGGERSGNRSGNGNSRSDQSRSWQPKKGQVDTRGNNPAEKSARRDQSSPRKWKVARKAG